MARVNPERVLEIPTVDGNINRPNDPAQFEARCDSKHKLAQLAHSMQKELYPRKKNLLSTCPYLFIFHLCCIIGIFFILCFLFSSIPLSERKANSTSTKDSHGENASLSLNSLQTGAAESSTSATNQKGCKADKKDCRTKRDKNFAWKDRTGTDFLAGFILVVIIYTCVLCMFSLDKGSFSWPTEVKKCRIQHHSETQGWTTTTTIKIELITVPGPTGNNYRLIQHGACARCSCHGPARDTQSKPFSRGNSTLEPRRLSDEGTMLCVCATCQARRLPACQQNQVIRVHETKEAAEPPPKYVELFKDALALPPSYNQFDTVYEYERKEYCTKCRIAFLREEAAAGGGSDLSLFFFILSAYLVFFMIYTA